MTHDQVGRRTRAGRAAGRRASRHEQSGQTRCLCVCKGRAAVAAGLSILAAAPRELRLPLFRAALKSGFRTAKCDRFHAVSA